MLIGDKDVYAVEIALEGDLSLGWAQVYWRNWVGGRRIGSFVPGSSLKLFCDDMKFIVNNNGKRDCTTLQQYDAHDLFFNYANVCWQRSGIHRYHEVAREEGWDNLRVLPSHVGGACNTSMLLLDGPEKSRIIVCDQCREIVEFVLDRGDVDRRLCEADDVLRDWHKEIAGEGHHVLLGDKDRFAVEMEFEGPSLWEWGDGKFCYWVAGRRCGLYRTGSILAHALESLEMSLCYSGSRMSETLWGLDASEVRSAYDAAVVYGLKWHHCFETARREQWGRLDITPNMGNEFDSTRVLLIDHSAVSRIVVSDYDRGAFEVVLERGYVDGVLEQGVKVLRKWDNLMAEYWEKKRKERA